MVDKVEGMLLLLQPNNEFEFEVELCALLWYFLYYGISCTVVFPC